jgi:hypothetical protein
MKKFVFAYLGGLLASAPAFTLFNDIGASPFSNLDAVMSKIEGSIVSIVGYFILLWVVPAFGAAIGAKLGGSGWDFQHIYRRGIGGQFTFSICFSILLAAVPSVGNTVFGLSTASQMAVFLMFSQIGCTLGAVWGM